MSKYTGPERRHEEQGFGLASIPSAQWAGPLKPPEE
jgi:hypothetical protein